MAKKVKRRIKGRSSGSESGQTRRFLLMGGAVVVGFVGLISLLVLNLQGSRPIEGVVEFPRQARGHVEEDIELAELPPVGGTHRNIWQNCGIYDEPIETAHAVHSLEHGAVWITYQPDLPAEQVEALRDTVRGDNFLLLSPYPGLRSPVVMTAWERQLELETAVDNRVSEFIEMYRLGPTTPEPGASCFNGVGTPVQ